MFHCIRWILMLVALAPLASSQEHGRDLDQARARWEHMSPAERARIAQHFDEFRGLPDAERERMLAHLQRVAEARRAIEASMPEELRAKLETLEPGERHQVLREYVESTMGERAERLREKLSPELVQKLDSATLAERGELLRAHHEELRKRAPRVFAYLGRQLSLPPEEIERLKSLGSQEMLNALGDLGRRDMQRRGPPPGVDPQEYHGWLALPPPEFMERMHCHGVRGFRGDGDRGGPPPDGQRGRFGEFGPPPDGLREGQRGGPPGGRLEGREGDRGPRPGPPGAPPPDGPRGPPRESRLRSDGQIQVLRALRPDSQWIVELAAQPREERRAEIDQRIHVRVVESLRTQTAVSAAELAQLDGLSGRDFFEALHDIIGDPPCGPGGERHRRERPRDELPPPRRE